MNDLSPNGELLRGINDKGADYFLAAMEFGLRRAWAASQLVVLGCTIPGVSDLHSQRDIALERLGLMQEKETSVQFAFAHSENTGPLAAWEGLFRGAVGADRQLDDNIPLSGDPKSGKFDLEQGISIAVERIERLERDRNLITYLVPNHYVTAPNIFMDIYDDPLGFVIFSSENDSILRGLIYPKEYADRWVEVIGLPLMAGTLPGTQLCPFRLAKDQLIQDVRRNHIKL